MADATRAEAAAYFRTLFRGEAVEQREAESSNYNEPIRKSAEQIKAECRDHHKNAGTMAEFYDQYPRDI